MLRSETEGDCDVGQSVFGSEGSSAVKSAFLKKKRGEFRGAVECA